MDEGLGQPLGLAVHGSHLYWVDRELSHIGRVDKFTGQQREIIQGRISHLSDIIGVTPFLSQVCLRVCVCERERECKDGNKKKKERQRESGLECNVKKVRKRKNRNMQRERERKDRNMQRKRERTEREKGCRNRDIKKEREKE